MIVLLMPLIFLYQFYFVRRKETVIEFTFNGKVHHTDTLPLPIDGTSTLFTRYSPKSLIVSLNPAVTEPIHLLKTRSTRIQTDRSPSDQAILPSDLNGTWRTPQSGRSPKTFRHILLNYSLILYF
jgi:hypothetical protein